MEGSSAQTIVPLATTGPNDLCDATKERIEYRAGTLARLFRLNEHDREDLVQDLSFAIFRATKKYDPSRASPETFARAVADLWYACNARRLRREALQRRLTVPLGYAAETEVTEKRYEKYTRADAAMDAVESVLHMPEYRRLAALMVGRLNETQIARVLGVDRGTIRRWFRGDGKNNCGNPRNKRADPTERSRGEDTDRSPA